MAVGTLCPKISFLAQKLRAVALEQTHRQTEKAKLRDPFFLRFIFFHYFYWVKPKNQKHMQKQGRCNKYMLTNSQKLCLWPSQIYFMSRSLLTVDQYIYFTTAQAIKKSCKAMLTDFEVRDVSFSS